ncbi:MAG: hypothetical protein BWY72_01750 [Bacteroidetes bacterium ADurb.Bin416]|nr:MAG: hypothetical protein BWY72_01750 [Bacteroidetes bacterium ADurb.Bin416]
MREFLRNRIEAIKTTTVCSYPNKPFIVFRETGHRIAMQPFRALPVQLKTIESLVVQTNTTTPTPYEGYAFLAYGYVSDVTTEQSSV